MSHELFPEIRGHDTLLDALGRAMEENRVASALLFHGPSGVGKLTTALALIRGLLCPATAPRACGRCDSCRRISPEALLHPDVGLLWPHKASKSEGAGEEPDGENLPADSPGGALNLHALQEQVRQNVPWRIVAESTRDRLQELFLSPAAGSRRVLLVLSAERLGNVSGNILLKMLEEPPGSSLIILLCENPSSLLPTIRSRCQACRFSPLPRRVVEEFLVERRAAPPGEAPLIASLSGGRIGAALLLASDAGAYRSRRDLLVRLLSAARAEGTASASLAAARVLTSEESGTGDDLSILMDILRDAMLSGAGCDPALLTDARAARGEGLPLLPPRQAAELLPRVERAREDLRRNVNRQMALEALFLDLADPHAPPPEWE